MDAVTAALAGLIDYAGLFPPAGLPLDLVADQYGRYRTGRHAWMLGRLVVPADRLAEAEGAAHRAGASVDEPWRVTALVGTAEQSDALAAALIDGHHRPRSVRVESVEAVAGSADSIARLARVWPTEFERYVEIPADPDPAPLMAALSAAGLFAKIRAGGIAPDRFPTTAHMARFLVRARDAGVPMKATAGLHHALRGDYRLTYEPESAKATMHGFVNLVLAATLLAAGKIDEELADACLDDDRADAFKLSGRAGSWLNGVVTYSELSHARRSLLRSVGSCSFDDPVAEIDALDFGLRGVDGGIGYGWSLCRSAASGAGRRAVHGLPFVRTSAIRAFTSRFTSAAGIGLARGNRIVPFEVSYPVSSGPRARLTAAVIG